eukprot:2978836-Prymnesium_polylepis.1
MGASHDQSIRPRGNARDRPRGQAGAAMFGGKRRGLGAGCVPPMAKSDSVRPGELGSKPSGGENEPLSSG